MPPRKCALRTVSNWVPPGFSRLQDPAVGERATGENVCSLDVWILTPQAMKPNHSMSLVEHHPNENREHLLETTIQRQSVYWEAAHNNLRGLLLADSA